MKLSFVKSPLKQIKADVLAVFLFQDTQLFQRDARTLGRLFGSRIAPLFDAGDFLGKEKDTAVVYLGRGHKSPRLLLVGIGEQTKLTPERLRRAAAMAAKKAKTLKASSLALAIPTLRKDVPDSIVALCEGASLALYKFDKYLTKEPEDLKKIQEIILCSGDGAAANAAGGAVRRAQIIVDATVAARDLANAPGNEIYPETLAEATKKSGEQFGFRVTVLEESEIEELGMGGVLGVCQGSSKPARFIILEYGTGGKPVVLVGKGVTFDTGGISIKPAASMAEMKMDMSGAAAVIGTFQAIARLKLPVHVVGLIPAVENMPSGSAVKPGDIIRHFNGKTSEVDNTDAEGRLILADALGYASRYNPAAVVDLATLTGACVVALGHVVTGMMGNDEGLMKRLKAAGEKTFERLWELPLYDEYEKLIKSDVADVKNVGGRWGGAITAGWFLKKFVGNYKWAHLDIAGTAILEEHGEYTQRGASGVGVRLLTEFLKSWK
ncbi:MAG: leucyl aminopeptidase [Bacteroidota bacterium]